MNLPSLRQLQYLLALVELRHFGKAAERCFVTQSTLSSGIQELENLLGVTLFERSKRKVMPTAEGEQVAERAQEILSLAGKMVDMCRYTQEPLSSPLTLGVIPTIGPYLLPWILPHIRQHFPKLELRLIEDQSERLLERLNRGQLDTAILAFPYRVDGFEQLIFWEENFRIALPREHKLAQQKSLSTQHLPKEELLLLEEGHCLTDHALEACKLHDLRISNTFQGTSLYTLLQMVAGGQGITFVPELALRTEYLSIQQDIALVELAEPGPHRQIGLVWRKSFFRKQDLKLLGQHIREFLQQQASS